MVSNVKDKDGKTPLHRSQEKTEIVKERSMVPDEVMSYMTNKEKMKHTYEGFDWIPKNQPKDKPPVGTPQEVILGVDGEISSLDKTKSSGHPYRSMGISRSDCFDPATGIITEKFLAEVESYLDKLAEEAEPQVNTNIVSTKVELLPMKDDKFMTPRLYKIAPLLNLVAMKMYFGWIFDNLKKHWASTDNAVGVNVYSAGWRFIASKLKLNHNAKNKDASFKFGGGDFKRWDRSIFYGFWRPFFHWANSFHRFEKGTRDFKILKNLCKSIVSSLNIVGGRLYSESGTLASGNFATTIFNCFVNRYIHKLGYIFFGLEKHGAFEENVWAWFYGDDSVWTVREGPISQGYTMLRLRDFFLSVFGIIYTPPTKDAKDFKKFLDREEVSFLKRDFVYDEDGNCLCPLEKGTIKSMLMYVDTSSDLTELEMFMAKSESAGSEAFMHGRKWFDEVRMKVNSRCKLLGITNNFGTYEERAAIYRAACMYQ